MPTNTYYFGLLDGVRIQRTNRNNETTNIKFDGDIVMPTYATVMFIAVIGMMTYLGRH